MRLRAALVTGQLVGHRMASQSLYRKWRSQTFADLVGQEAVVRTLLNAVREGRLAHAYLFCGPRGTGKTSTARLLAKAVNCTNPRNGEPCNECISCREITAGHSPDVIEIDAASNTGVDNIRDLRETVGLMGTGGRYKLYIVDEVHMLSTAAFNALLKTLEEPPPHIIFVLATTEAHKVLPTVVSRCQRFDFRRINTRDIIGHLEHVAAAEELALDPAAAELLARAAQGGMRDALSLLDQAMAYCGTQIIADRVREMLGLADSGLLRRLIAYVADGNAADGLALLNNLVTEGADLRQLNSQLAEEWRALVLARAGADVAMLTDRTEDEAREIAALAGRFSLDDLTACARVFARNEGPARGLPVPQLALELSFLECVGIKTRGSAQPAMQSPVQSAPTISPAQSAPRPMPAAQASRPESIAMRQSPPMPERGLEAPRQPAAAEVTRRVMAPQPAVEELDLDEIEHDVLPPAGANVANGLAPTASPALPLQSSIAPVKSAVPMMPPEDEPPYPDEPAVDEDWADEDAPTVVGDNFGEILTRAQSRWQLIIQVCKQKSVSTHALLKNARPLLVEPGEPPVLVLQADYKFHHDKLREPTQRGAVEWAASQVLELPVRVKVVQANSGESGGSSGNGPAGRGGPAPNGGNDRSGAGPAARGPAQSSMPAAASLARPSASASATPAAINGSSVAVHDSAAPYSAASAPGPLRPAAQRNPDIRPVRSLEEEVRADPVIETLIRSYGVELADVRALDDRDGE